MSTRGYYGIRKNGELKGTYNHWDSYPSGLGKDLVETINKIKKEDRIKVLSDTFDYIKLVDDDTPPTKEQRDMCLKANTVDLHVGGCSLDEWYCLLRKTQGDLGFYINRVIPYMENGNDFVDDALYCEWGYIIDLDKNKFEVIYGYEGRTKKEFDLLNLDLKKVLKLEKCGD